MDTSNFDVDELKHLALKAMRADREEDALRLIKAALAQAPQNEELLYLLAMAHSNLGMVDRAVEELSQVLAIAPGLVNGRFQLGLLHFTRREFKQSESVWKPLIATLEEQSPLRHFAIGLTKVCNGQLQEAIPILERGISLCANAELNADMGRIAADCRRALAGAAAKRTEAKDASASSQHVLLSQYNSRVTGLDATSKKINPKETR